MSLAEWYDDVDFSDSEADYGGSMLDMYVEEQPGGGWKWEVGYGATGQGVSASREEAKAAAEAVALGDRMAKSAAYIDKTTGDVMKDTKSYGEWLVRNGFLTQDELGALIGEGKAGAHQINQLAHKHLYKAWARGEVEIHTGGEYAFEPKEPNTGVDEDVYDYMTHPTRYRGPAVQRAAAPASVDEHTSVMVAFFLPPEDAEALSIEGGEEPEIMHITLCYLGKKDGLDRETIQRVCEEYATTAQPIKGKVGGFGVFNTEKDGRAVVALFDSPEIDEFQYALAADLEDEGVPVAHDHGFNPHITLTYLEDENAELPLTAITNRDITFDTLTLAWGDERIDWHLGAPSVETQTDDDVEPVAAARTAARWAVGVEEEGLGNVVWEGEAATHQEALARAGAQATDLVDVNGDGSLYESHGWDGRTLFVERVGHKTADDAARAGQPPAGVCRKCKPPQVFWTHNGYANHVERNVHRKEASPLDREYYHPDHVRFKMKNPNCELCRQQDLPTEGEIADAELRRRADALTVPGHKLEMISTRGGIMAGCSCDVIYKNPNGRQDQVWATWDKEKIRAAHRQHLLEVSGRSAHRVTADDDLAALAAQLYEMGAAHEPEITADVDEVAKAEGAELYDLDFRLKSQDSIARKLEKKITEKGLAPEEAVKDITDVVRYTMVMPTDDYADAAQDALWRLEEKGYGVVGEADNYWDTGDAYSGLQFDLMTPWGLPMELQFHTQESFQTSRGNHGLYEEYRLPSTPTPRKQELFDTMTKQWDAVPVPPNALQYDKRRRQPRPARRVVAVTQDDVVAALEAAADDFESDERYQGIEADRSWQWILDSINDGISVGEILEAAYQTATEDRNEEEAQWTSHFLYEALPPEILSYRGE